jgi:hypothetical protein
MPRDINFHKSTEFKSAKYEANPHLSVGAILFKVDFKWGVRVWPGFIGFGGRFL